MAERPGGGPRGLLLLLPLLVLVLLVLLLPHKESEGVLTVSPIDDQAVTEPLLPPDLAGSQEAKVERAEDDALGVKDHVLLEVRESEGKESLAVDSVGLPFDQLLNILLTERGDRFTLPGVTVGSSSMLLSWLEPFHGLPGSNSGTAKSAR